MANKDDRLFTTKPFRHYRRTYSVVEVRWGIGVLIGLCAITGWVIYKGQHPDPSLTAAAPGQVRRGEDLGGQVAPGLPGAKIAAAAKVDRGPIPADVAPPGFTERSLATFGPDNVYEKINGREGYYKSFGFERLWFLSFEDKADPMLVIDLEVYDLATPQNALGAFAGETPAEVSPELKPDGLYRLDRNAAFLTRGRYYVRAVAADETETIRAALTHIGKSFSDGVEGAQLPWSYALFVGALGAKPGKVAYVAENAFSFGFAKGVHVAGMEGDLEIFVMPVKDEAAAARMAKQFVEGWLSYGDAEGRFVKDRYLSQLAGARAAGRFVVGLRGAETKAAADAMMSRITRSVAALPPQTVASIEAVGSGDDARGEDEAAADAEPAADSAAERAAEH